MLHAALQGKVSVNAGKDEHDHVTKINEDSLTSIVFGLMTYLPGNLAWSLLEISSAARANIDGLPHFRYGRLEKAEFWPAWNPMGRNVRLTEPDAYFRFIMGDPDVVIDIVVEAKRGGWASQCRDQWNSQIAAYADTILSEETDPPDQLYYFAVSGLDKGFSHLVESLKVPSGMSPKPRVVIADWIDFSNAARQLRDMGDAPTKRLMTMILQGLAQGGFVERVYFKSLAPPRNLDFQRHSVGALQ